MKSFFKKTVAAAVLAGISSLCFSAPNACPNNVMNGSTKICYYDNASAGNYAINNYLQSAAGNDGTFVAYSSNCTNFVSQALMAGFSGKSTRSTVFNVKDQYLADQYDSYSWYYKTATLKGNTWAEAHSLYLYAKWSSLNDIYPPYNSSGLKFSFITNDSLTSFMDYTKVQVGDVIFMDYKTSTGAYGNDNVMDHVFIVTRIQSWRLGYDEIRVASNTNTYEDKGLGTINEEYNKKALFYVYRPKGYVIK